MHAPDGFFNAGVNVASGIISGGVLLYAVRKTYKNLDRQRVYMMAAVAAFIFAVQMLNFTVSAGTSGHLLGGVTAAIMLGPWAGTIVMAIVILIQAFVFQDGGITALGPNILNMGIWGTVIGYFIYAVIKTRLGNIRFGMYMGAFIASWAAVMLAAFFCSLQLALSGVLSLKELLPPMLMVHAKIGMGEGMITLILIYCLTLLEPQLLWHDVKFEEEIFAEGRAWS